MIRPITSRFGSTHFGSTRFGNRFDSRFAKMVIRSVSRAIARRSETLPALRIPVLAALSLTAVHSTVTAEIVTDRFVCSISGESRTIELTYLNEIDSVPCEIRETRADGRTRALWRANFDVAFCQTQMNVHRARLTALGWPCKTGTADQLTRRSSNESLSTRALQSWQTNARSKESNSTANAENLNQPNKIDSTITATLSTGAATGSANSSSLPTATVTLLATTAPEQQAPAIQHAATGQSPPLAGEVTFFEGRRTVDNTRPAINTAANSAINSTASSAASSTANTTAASAAVSVANTSEATASAKAISPATRPLPPNVAAATGQLGDDDIREIDDWLIYLSAQSMASIQHLLRDSESFNNFQLDESLNSDNIYIRLQNRIEFLQSLLQKQ